MTNHCFKQCRFTLQWFWWHIHLPTTFPLWLYMHFSSCSATHSTLHIWLGQILTNFSINNSLIFCAWEGQEHQWETLALCKKHGLAPSEFTFSRQKLYTNLTCYQDTLQMASKNGNGNDVLQKEFVKCELPPANYLGKTSLLRNFFFFFLMVNELFYPHFTLLLVELRLRKQCITQRKYTSEYPLTPIAVASHGHNYRSKNQQVTAIFVLSLCMTGIEQASPLHLTKHLTFCWRNAKCGHG